MKLSVILSVCLILLCITLRTSSNGANGQPIAVEGEHGIIKSIKNKLHTSSTVQVNTIFTIAFDSFRCSCASSKRRSWIYSTEKKSCPWWPEEEEGWLEKEIWARWRVRPLLWYLWMVILVRFLETSRSRNSIFIILSSWSCTLKYVKFPLAEFICKVHLQFSQLYHVDYLFWN